MYCCVKNFSFLCIHKRLNIYTMNNILVIGSTGQIGSELTRKLRGIYGNANVVAGYIKGAEPKGELAEAGPMAECDVTNPQMIADVVKKYNIDAIYNLAALLSVVAESKPRLAWYRRSVEHPRSSSRARLRCVHSEFNRFVRLEHTEDAHTAGHYPASAHYLRHFEGYY